MKKQFGEYYLGFDIGTDSIGFAATDLEYNLLRLNGKDMWGSRLFTSGQTAQKRRLFRTARRRLQRRNQRLQLLQELFSAEISKVDFAFFQRLADSKFYVEDKNEKQPNTIFNDADFKDKDYHDQFPTIYHLRKALIENKTHFDVRLVYLAIHHILKHRGHFLFEGQSMENVTSFEFAFRALNANLRDELEIELLDSDLDKVAELLKTQTMGLRDKKNKLGELLGADSQQADVTDKKIHATIKKQKQAIISLLCGGTAKLSEVFNNQELEEEELNSISFADSKYEEQYDDLNNLLLEKMRVLEMIKTVYDWAILAEIRQNEQYLAFAKVKVYEKHRQDIQRLKAVIKKYCSREAYFDLFSNPALESNYCAYIGMTKKNHKKEVIEKSKCKQADFCKYVKGLLKELDEKVPDIAYLRAETENGTLAPKQAQGNNGVIPYQMHLEELNSILENASQYLPFLSQKDETGFTVAEKIRKIMTFRIPYYVGPLNDAHKAQGANCWLVKKSDEKIRPWNFDVIVDKEASAENFIQRMTNKCTYLVGADVLPKNSLLYSEFMVLNELNNVRVDGDLLPVDLKQHIYQELFKKFKHITGKRFQDFMVNNGYIEKTAKLSGFDGDFKSSLTSWIDFQGKIGTKANNLAMVENIIKWIVLFGDSRQLLKMRIQKNYGEILSAQEITSLCSLHYSGWGRLSQEFLQGITAMLPEEGREVNLLEALRATNNNLMELLSSKYSFNDAIKDYNKQQTTDEGATLSYKLVDELYVSPAVKRGIWQTLTMAEELKTVLGHDPKKVFIEMTRSDEKNKKRTISRRKTLIDLYKKCHEESRNWIKELEVEDDNALRSDRLYLYYTQMGRCMYTGEAISFAQLFNQNIYDVDHIFPQSKIKDDSIENRVLVKRQVNADKSDQYPLPSAIRMQQKTFWSMLYSKGFIGRKKFDRLTRATGFDDNELADFIARQIVETSQATKAVAEILGRLYPKTEIVYVKANNVSEFRQHYALVKCRDVNDYHHAKDAYLNIVVGNVYNTKFTHSPVNFIRGHNGEYSLNRMYDFPVERQGTHAWTPGEAGSIVTVKKTMQGNRILFTRYATEVKSGLFDQNLMKKGKGQLPVKNGPDQRLTKIDCYGGYNKVTGAYFFLVEHTVKQKRVRTLEFVPVHLAARFEKAPEQLSAYCQENLGLKSAKILLPKIKIDTLFKVDGFKMHLSGRTGQQLVFKGANQLVLTGAEEVYLKKISKFVQRSKETKGAALITKFDVTTKEENMDVTIKEEDIDVTTREKNLDLFDRFISKLTTTVYQVRLAAQVKTLVDGREKFINLTLEQQWLALSEILHLFQCNSVASDLSLIGGGKSAGIIKKSKNITEIQQISILNQSPTGLFTQEINLLRL
ncbi:MAG: type II CRISPR RNA-guided endonuclease Cas9 [Acidaminococcaceae bacterium]